jgi:hypothetical protein
MWGYLIELKFFVGVCLNGFGVISSALEMDAR